MALCLLCAFTIFVRPISKGSKQENGLGSDCLYIGYNKCYLYCLSKQIYIFFDIESLQVLLILLCYPFIYSCELRLKKKPKLLSIWINSFLTALLMGMSVSVHAPNATVSFLNGMIFR